MLFKKDIISRGESVSLPFQFLEEFIFVWWPPSVFKSGNRITLTSACSDFFSRPFSDFPATHFHL